MTQQIERAVVRIFTQGANSVCGAGFLVAPQHILTCAHVVAEALDLDWTILEDKTAQPEELLQIDFPNLSETILLARVLYWSPINTTDIAVLELTSPAPTLARPVPLKLERNFIKHSYAAYGFNQDEGRWTNGTVRGPISNGNVQLNSDADAWQPIARGFSGTAIWDEQEKGAVGMVVAVDTGDRRIAYMIPVSKLCEVWPPLKAYLPGYDAINKKPWVTVASFPPIESIPQWAFVAYAPEDEDVVERLHQDILPFGVWLWSLEQEQLAASFTQNNDKIRNAMRHTSLVLLITSPVTAESSVVRDQMALAADYHCPVLIVWTSGRDEELPLAEAWQAETVIDARNEHYERVRTELLARLKLQGTTGPSLQKELFPLKEPRNPYKGLHAFTANDARDFFGRATLVRELTAVLEQILSQDTTVKRPIRLLTVLLGASGSGKSSVVMAGLLPFLQQQGIFDSREWIYLDPVLPGKHPLEALAIELAKHPALGNVLSIHHALESDSLGTLHLLTRQLAGSSSRKVVLFIDQFEEVFTLTASEKERLHFFSLLETAVTDPQGSLLVLLTLRIDFYDRLVQYPDLYRLLDANRVSVLPMERADLREVIVGPAQLSDVQITFEDGLVGDLLLDVREQSAPLPLLQFTLDQLFTLRKGRQLTLDAYRKIGGVKGALVKHAEKTYNDLPSEEHRELAQPLFMRLIDFGPTHQDIARHRATLAEFELADSQLTEFLQETRDAFIDARLLTTNEVADTITVEVSHEALLREWPRCRDWVEETRKNLPAQQTLRNDVAQWDADGKPKERLYRGSQMKTLKKRVNPRLLNKQEAFFLRASAAHQRQQGIKTISLLLLPVIILSLVVSPILVFRPAWCPSWLCLMPPVKGGIYDTNLQVTFQTLQSSFKILSGEPSTYTLANLPLTPSTDTLGNRPTTGDAQLIYPNQTLPYRVVLKIHSLRPRLFIDQVTLVVKKQAQAMPYPLRVYIANNVTIYNNNLYRVTYRGQPTNAVLTALYEAQPLALDPVSLLPGETDELSLEVRSTVVADLHFQVQVTYHVLGQLATPTLTLPNIFEVVFSDPANWHPYQFQAGHMVATS